MLYHEDDGNDNDIGHEKSRSAARARRRLCTNDTRSNTKVAPRLGLSTLQLCNSFGFVRQALLAGSWLVKSGVISPLLCVISIVALLISPLTTTLEPPRIPNRLSPKAETPKLSGWLSCVPSAPTKPKQILFNSAGFDYTGQNTFCLVSSQLPESQAKKRVMETTSWIRST